MKRVARVTEQLIEDLRRNKGSDRVTPRVLVVEDDADDVFLLKRVLSHFGCSVTIANTGADALHLINESSRPDEPDFDIVFLDLALPGMRGIEVLRRIRAITKSLPVVVVTGTDTAADRADLSESGYVALVQKPLNAADASEILSKHRIHHGLR